MLKRILILFGVILFLISCATIRLEKKLPSDISKWYKLHSTLMEIRIPQWIAEKKMTEKRLFLLLPEETQRKYVSVFWKIRPEGLNEVFYTQVYTANRLFGGEGKPGWMTDRGKVLMVCGFPFFYRKVTVNDLVFRFSSDPRNAGRQFATPPHDTDGTVYEIWEYYYRRIGVRFVFNYIRGGDYRLNYNQLGSTSRQMEFIRYCKEIFAPTEDGWDLLGGWLLNWLKEKK